MKTAMKHLTSTASSVRLFSLRPGWLRTLCAIGSVAANTSRWRFLMQSPQVSAQAGFTLLEILVALAILTTALATIVPLLTDTARRTDQAELTQLALVLAEAKSSEVGTTLALKPAVLQGTEGKGTWTVHIQPAEAGLGENALGVAVYEVVVSARQREGDKEQTVTLRTLRTGTKE